MLGGLAAASAYGVRLKLFLGDPREAHQEQPEILEWSCRWTVPRHDMIDVIPPVFDDPPRARSIPRMRIIIAPKGPELRAVNRAYQCLPR